MSGLSGFLGGVILLSTAQLVLSSPTATSAFGSLLQAPSSWFEKFVSPAYGIVPNLAGSGQASDSSLLQTTPSSTQGVVTGTGASSNMPDVASLPPTSAPATLT